MKKYVVYIADRFTKIPLVKAEVNAISKFHAKTIVKRDLTRGDKGYIITACKKGA